MPDSLADAREHFIQGLSRIAHFWGFPKAMGATYAAIYLSPEPLTLDDICRLVEVSKGAASTHVRSLERLQTIHKILRVGDRKDYYRAETDFWKIVKGILRQREQHEFDRALKSVDESLEMVRTARSQDADPAVASFHEERMMALQRFFHSLDSLVGMILALDEFRVGSITALLKPGNGKNGKG